jgi:PIN domain nuclease of toxin-antitoxin system
MDGPLVIILPASEYAISSRMNDAANTSFRLVSLHDAYAEHNTRARSRLQLHGARDRWPHTTTRRASTHFTALNLSHTSQISFSFTTHTPMPYAIFRALAARLRSERYTIISIDERRTSASA